MGALYGCPVVLGAGCVGRETETDTRGAYCFTVGHKGVAQRGATTSR